MYVRVRVRLARAYAYVLYHVCVKSYFFVYYCKMNLFSYICGVNRYKLLKLHGMKRIYNLEKVFTSGECFTCLILDKDGTPILYFSALVRGADIVQFSPSILSPARVSFYALQRETWNFLTKLYRACFTDGVDYVIESQLF